jgi:hypothetical protein
MATGETRLAVVLASGTAKQDFARDKRALQIVADRLIGGFDADEPLRARDEGARPSEARRRLSGALGQIRGRHNSLIYVGPQLGCRVSRDVARHGRAAEHGRRV